MTLNEVIDTLQTWIRNADDEYDREEMGRVAGLKEALHEIKKIEPCGKDINVPATDAISRQAVLEIQTKYTEHIGATKFWQMRDDIKELPSVTPQPKTGHWKYIGNGHNGLFKCDKCGAHRNMFDELEKYCYACGAKMAEEWGIICR